MNREIDPTDKEPINYKISKVLKIDVSKIDPRLS